MASFQPRTVSIQELVQRDQTQNSVPQNTVNTVIAVTVVLGVIFIAFALFVIYWMYMRSVDRRDRREQQRRERLARLATSRKQKDRSSRALQQKSSFKKGATKCEYGRPRGGDAWSPGKYNVPRRRSLTHHISGLGWPKSYLKPIPSYQDSYLASSLGPDGPRERDVELGLKAENGAGPPGFGPKGPHWYPSHSAHYNSSRSFSSSFSDSGSSPTDIRRLTPLPTSYQNSASIALEETGHAGFPPGLTPRNPAGMGHHSDDTGPSNSHHI